MFKTKLQEVCHKKKWALPVYSCVKDGPPHNPLFRASVSVNGVSFTSPDISKSSKEALNQAAQLAFLHFTCPPSDAEPIGEGTAIGDTRNGSQCHENAPDAKTDARLVSEGAARGEKHNGSELHANATGGNIDTQHKYKMQLQTFAKSQKLDPPKFSNKKEGPPHALRFQATVTINGNSFESPGWFTNLKDAEHAAAKVALMTLSPEASQEVDIHLYKNLLQELAQNEGLLISEYKTRKCGPPHQITFFSAVEVEGEVFHGTGEHLKKLAELSAAKAAYLVLMERKSSRSGSGSPGKELSQVTPDSVKQSEEQVNRNKGKSITSGSPGKLLPQITPDSVKQFEEQVKENKDKIVSAETSPVLQKSNLEGAASSTALSKKAQLPSASTIAPVLSALSIAETKTKKATDMNCYLLCSRFKVYTSTPDIVLPKGTVLLPIDEGKWVPVSLEFPNEKISA